MTRRASYKNDLCLTVNTKLVMQMQITNVDELYDFLDLNVVPYSERAAPIPSESVLPAVFTDLRSDDHTDFGAKHVIRDLLDNLRLKGSYQNIYVRYIRVFCPHAMDVENIIEMFGKTEKYCIEHDINVKELQMTLDSSQLYLNRFDYDFLVEVVFDAYTHFRSNFKAVKILIEANCDVADAIRVYSDWCISDTQTGVKYRHRSETIKMLIEAEF